MARDLVVMLMTETYLASLPILMVGLSSIVVASIPIDGLLRVYAKTNVLLAINLVRLAMIAVMIQWAIRSFGLVGAILVTMFALTIGKAIGLAAAASLWRVEVGRLLPWRALFLIAVVALAAAMPALAVSYGLQAAPAIRILAIGAAYASVYVAMVLSVGLVSSHERAAASQLLGKLQFMLPVRYQHKTS